MIMLWQVQGSTWLHALPFSASSVMHDEVIAPLASFMTARIRTGKYLLLNIRGGGYFFPRGHSVDYNTFLETLCELEFISVGHTGD